MPEIRALYESGKAGRWNPLRDISWDALGVDDYDPPVREAARRAWSRRVWVEATGLTETPALLMRFCMEAHREIDPKFYLTVRNTEEAWHVECFDRLAEAFGGRIVRPGSKAYEAVFNQNLPRRVLNADQHLDAYVAVHAAFEDGLELELYRAWRRAAKNPVIASVLDHIISDKERHAAFGWLYLGIRAPHWSETERKLISEELVRHVNEVELQGYHCPWLAPEHAGAEAEAEAVLAANGLGATGRSEEEDVIVSYVANARQKLAELGIKLPVFETNRMRAF
ncbi:ferritin-like domain-containing protein [Amorphus sp. 3PC139-8]|uniref:ferritin-like domain-containing protein n=1 Tax=Amorphus sp. 3PC139-8 TaxID=2735676 RepID=UPI00345CE9D4